MHFVLLNDFSICKSALFDTLYFVFYKATQKRSGLRNGSFVLKMFKSGIHLTEKWKSMYTNANSIHLFQLTSQVYISEIAHSSIRGSLCSVTKVASQIGLLSAFAMGAEFDWRQLALVCAGAPVMLLITAQYIPETPSFLLYTNQEERAEKALQWLRGPDADM